LSGSSAGRTARKVAAAVLRLGVIARGLRRSGRTGSGG
jgi:hypothetical protein